MTNADSAALAVIVMTPLVLLARAYVRRTRGEPFTADELATAVGTVAVALVAVALVRSPSFATLLPAGLAAFGVLLVVGARSQPAGPQMARLGYAAIGAGLLGLVLAIARTALG
ncbi:MAG TPA: hypothetical protein VFI34_08780 [Candidatus Limnocylindrales bacterium]|nr:hypothetical protein [Candidatus Limnocylindrales bacterium]